MLIKKAADIRYSEITPKRLYLDRRRFLAGVPGAFLAAKAFAAGTKFQNLAKSPFSTTEKENSYNDITHYNNYYEFGTDKGQPAENAKNFKTSPWQVSVEGDVAKPGKYSIEDLMALAPMEERIYRHRCVEAWSIVVPWVGYSLSALLKKVEPTPKAKFVAFETFYKPSQMPLGRSAGIDLPYVDGLRLDEAMHPLTMLTFGLYGETLPPQNGAPVRLTVPWKYGFKSVKSIVKIKVVSSQPPCTWNITNPSEYGFYSNVNPKVDHPRWSQASERRLGEFFKRPTLMFNGYGDQVAGMYTGMDLKKYF
ncbi:MAG TPA: protein-methionine-sulfoxide reductase catalytic subunit MsrP [Candidatus Limnocylindrales bacterium]|nr:protein-methionine-sulfoxide reductase catalytic subunit MsrP [Candidatus Limnocylindrales bacterium]